MQESESGLARRVFKPYTDAVAPAREQGTQRGCRRVGMGWGGGPWPKGVGQRAKRIEMQVDLGWAAGTWGDLKVKALSSCPEPRHGSQPVWVHTPPLRVLAERPRGRHTRLWFLPVLDLQDTF